MIIKKIAVGNMQEAYIENNLNADLNIISSDDNNRGKTIVIQSLIYALGNVPVFPATFNYKEYYHLVEFEKDNEVFLVCRYNNNFVISKNNAIMILDSVSEFKKYWSKHISKLPHIKKNGMDRVVDPELFVQIYFIGQDKKDTSNIANKGFYNKADFYSMIFDYMNLGVLSLSDNDVEKVKENLKKLKSEKSDLLKEYKILNSKDVVTNYLSQHSDKVTIGEMLKKVEEEKDIISDLRIARNKELSRKTKFEIALKELKSLNRGIKAGKLQCMDCGSGHISYSTDKSEAYIFDVSTTEVREQIMDSITEKIESCSEEFDRITTEINIHQDKLQLLLKDETVSLESIVLHKQDIMDIDGVEVELKRIDIDIEKINETLKELSTNISGNLDKQKKLLEEIVNVMNDTYKLIDPYGTLQFDELFTKKDVVFSGAESTIFHLTKLFAFSKVLEHKYPIIVDSFRAEDLSTEKEKKVIELFNTIDKQVIFTTTLKVQEIDKYKDIEYINHIDYSSHTPSKILNEAYLNDFKKLLNRLKVNIK